MILLNYVDENFTWLIRKNVGHHILLKIFIYTIYKENHDIQLIFSFSNTVLNKFHYYFIDVIQKDKNLYHIYYIVNNVIKERTI